MSQSIVLDIVQDRQGFMWFCTEDGLNRYDGYTFSVLRNDPQDRNSISHNYTLCILKDRDGDLWIGTFYGGLNRYDCRTETFTHFRADPSNDHSLCHDIVRTLYQDREGTIWIGTDGGLNKLNPKTDSLVSYYHNPHNPHSLSDNRVRSICEDRHGDVWIATENGLSCFDKTHDSFTNYFHDPVNRNSLAANQTRVVLSDRQGAVWVGTDGAGLDRLTFNADGSVSFTHYVHDENDPYSLGDNYIYSLFEDDTGALWVGSNGGGLSILDPLTQQFETFTYNPLNPNSISYDEIYAIYQDRSGVMWLGTYGGGLSRVSRTAEQFLHIQADATIDNSLNANIVWSIYEDDMGLLWIGTHGGGLNRYNRLTNEWTTFQHDPQNPLSLGHNIVRVITQDSEGLFWLGTEGGGVDRFDPDTGEFTHYRHNPNDPTSLSHDEIRCIFEDKRGTLWIGTHGGGLNRLNRATGTFTSYRHHPQQPNSLSNDYVRVIHESPDGMLWIGTHGGGLNKFDPRAETFTHYRAQDNDSTRLSNDFVFSILQDDDGVLWIGTWGGGLNKLDPARDIFHHYKTEHGLADNAIYGVLQDEFGNLWMSSNNGLCQFNPVSGEVHNYSTDDGLQSTEFNGGAYFQSRSGEMFFGGINGFNAFYPETVHENEHVPPVVLTEFLKFNEPVDLTHPISTLQDITLGHRDYVFAFEFAALDFTAPERNQYAYKMEGLDDDWIYTNAAKRFATYTTLPPGKYTFRVKGSNNDGIWNEQGASLGVIIRPAVWQTWWFKLMLGLLVLAFVFAAYRWRMKTIHEKRRVLEARVQERTKAAKTLQDALDEVERLKNRLQAENIYLQDEIKIVTNFENIITQSQSLKKVLRKVEQVAATDATVLILGESGTGKELIARAIHNISNRSERILVKVNCSALPTNLIESELFGHEKGAFTGAISQKIGRFELAHGGTLFLDEIGDLPLELQAKLLRVLQEGEFERVGSSKTIKVDVRIIAATNRELSQEIKSGQFREDLYFRLNVFPLQLPPLRERQEDIPLLVKYFIKKYSAKIGKSIDSLPAHAMETFMNYDWPGNVRELEHVIERTLITSQGKRLTLSDWLPHNGDHKSTPFLSLEENEKQHIIKALNLTNWRVSGDNGAAKLLDINPKTLESRMRRLHIQRNS